MLKYIIIVLVLAGPNLTANAQSLRPTCASVLPTQSYEAEFGPTDPASSPNECVINWLQKGKLTKLTWKLYENGLEPPVLQSVAPGEYMLTSSRPPNLLDVDQDGWLDLTNFTLYGMVNGDYDIFRYDPNRDDFTTWHGLNGHTFVREDEGFFVSAARNGAASTVFAFYKNKGRQFLPHFHMEVHADDSLAARGTPQCSVSIDQSTLMSVDEALSALNTSPVVQTFLPKEPAMLLSYCDIYRSSARRDRGTPLAKTDTDAVIVPDGAAFYCRLEDTDKEVAVIRDDDKLRYRFGPIYEEPELVMDRAFNAVEFVTAPSKNGEHSGSMTFVSDGYSYKLHYQPASSGEGDNRNSSTTSVTKMNLSVFKGDTADTTVFDRACILETSFADIGLLK